MWQAVVPAEETNFTYWWPVVRALAAVIGSTRDMLLRLLRAWRAVSSTALANLGAPRDETHRPKYHGEKSIDVANQMAI